MGFRSGAWATCWSVEPVSDTVTRVRLSTSRKDKQTGDYNQDFSGFVSFLGTAAAKKASMLKERDRIKLGDVDVTTKYDADKKREYINYQCYSFETQNNQQFQDGSADEPEPGIDEIVDSVEDDNRLPY